MMRKVTILFFLLCCIITLVSCKKETTDVTNLENDYFEYPMDGIGFFDVDNNGILYYSSVEATEDVITYMDDKKQELTTNGINTIIKSIDSNGNELNSYIVQGLSANHLSIDQDNIYFTTSMQINEEEYEISFYEYSLENQSSKLLYQLTGTIQVNRIDVINHTIYFLGIDSKKINKEYTLANEEDTYYYSGEVMGILDLTSGIYTEIPVDFPIAYSKTTDHNLMIYAHDNDGYYFAQYNTIDGTLSNKIYHNLGKIFHFSVDANKEILFGNYETSTFCLSSTTLDEEGKVIDLLPSVSINSIVCRGDYTYYKNAKNSNKIERIKTSTYVRGNKTLQMLSSLKSYSTPFGCGYTIDREYTTPENLALLALSQDSNYDICLMNSRQGISENIRNKGSFYPLNKVEGVEAYLDSCFPYIKEAATTKDGDIWMLPIQVDIPYIIYNEVFCKENGIDFSVPMDFEEFLNSLQSIRQNNFLESTYHLSPYLLMENFFYQYLRSNTNFSTDYFDRLAPVLKSEANYLVPDQQMDLNAVTIANMLYQGKTDNLLLNSRYYLLDGLKYMIKYQDLRASSLPSLQAEQDTNIATCLFVSVNPSSKNLKEALNYIKALCQYTLDQDNLMMFGGQKPQSNNPGVWDLYHIYENGDIRFTLPEEVYLKDYEKYLKGDIDLSTFKKEANRKIDSYLKE